MLSELECFGNLLKSLEVLAEHNKMTRLWVDCLGKPALLMMIFIQAEREGDWSLQLWAAVQMFPYFSAAGHYSYGWYGLLVSHIYGKTFTSNDTKIHERGACDAPQVRHMGWTSVWHVYREYVRATWTWTILNAL